VLKISWQQALAWRMQRHLLDPIGSEPVAGVVRRLGGIQSQVPSSAELAIRVRQERSRSDDVSRALADGRLIKTWAMRGTLHLLTPEDGGAFLSILAFGRSWERPAWERWIGMTPEHWNVFRAVVREALANGPLPRDKLATAILAEPRLSHLGDELRSGWGTLYKPLAWQGDLCFGPGEGNRTTFARPDLVSAQWAGVPPAEEAATRVIVAYLGAYGPATIEHLHNWLARGRVSVRQLRAWFVACAERLAEVEVDGERAFVLTEHLDELAASRPSAVLRLLPGFDQWVLGPGTDDGHVTPRGRRATVSRQSGWISPVVVAGGVVSGTWALDGDVARIAWFNESGAPPRKKLKAEVARLASILDRDLWAEISRV
jgi:DNA glycosylase AlkZ-like